MKRFALVGFFIAAASVAVAKENAFDSANAKYQSGDFKSAAALYEKAVSEKGATAALYYDLGNAAFKNGKKGLARVSYERALGITPRDRDLRWNLDILKSTLADRAEPPSDVLRAKWAAVLSNVTVNESALCFMLSIFLLALASWAVFARMGRIFVVGRVFFTVLVLVSGFLFSAKWFDTRDARVVITVKETPVRYGPSVKETKAFTLHEGALVRLGDETQNWLYVSLDDKRAGWIPKQSGEILR